MYIVIRDFCDLQDEKYLYREGDEFPRRGRKVSEERLRELSSTSNKTHFALIEEVKESIPVENSDSSREKKGRKNARRITEGSEELLHS